MGRESDRNPAFVVAVVSAVLAAAAVAGAFAYWEWRGNRMRVDTISDDLGGAILNGTRTFSTPAPSLVPLWLLIGLAAVAVIVCVGTGVAAYLNRHRPGEAAREVAA